VVLNLAVIPEYSDQYVPKSACKEFPPPLNALKDAKYIEMEHCKNVKLFSNQ